MKKCEFCASKGINRVKGQHTAQEKTLANYVSDNVQNGELLKLSND
jgi:hypothetical protein